jgi:hypothetical protein
MKGGGSRLVPRRASGERRDAPLPTAYFDAGIVPSSHEKS